MPHFINNVNQEEFYSELEDVYRYEITVTYNPKYIDTIEYAETMTDYVHHDLQRFLQRQSTVCDYKYNYVVEHHENGYPHIHGTLYSYLRIKPESLFNLEKSLQRKYGRSSIWATDKTDKIHHNDHFTGTWQEYLHKEGEPKYYLCTYQM